MWADDPLRRFACRHRLVTELAAFTQFSCGQEGPYVIRHYRSRRNGDPFECQGFVRAGVRKPRPDKIVKRTGRVEEWSKPLRALISPHPARCGRSRLSLGRGSI